MAPEISVVVPVRNDAVALGRLLARLSRLVDARTEIIVVDGQSGDASAALAEQAGCRLLQSPSGRGRQLNLGCRHARGAWLWMLHADSQVSREALNYLLDRRVPGWGRFDIGFESDRPAMQVVAGLMNARSRLTGICTGDQGIFVHRDLLAAIHGVPEQPLMEDVELSRRLKRLGTPLCPRIRLTTSPRRWDRDGWLSTVLVMWRLRLAYWWGTEPDRLARDYYG